MAFKVVVNKLGFRELEPKVQAGMLATLQEASKEIEDAVKREAPVQSGELLKSIKLGQIINFGPHRFQVNVESDSSYWEAVVYGFPAQTVGAENKKYGAGEKVWTGQYILPSRPANNFPRRAIRKFGPQKIRRLVAQNFIVRVKQ
jgi:hypothetical protein